MLLTVSSHGLCGALFKKAHERMKKASKIQRTDHHNLPELQTEDAEESKASAAALVSLDSGDHQTTSSLSEFEANHCYNVVDDKFDLSVASPAGFVNIRLKLKPLFDRLGLKRIITDTKSTIKAVKLLKTTALSPRASTSTDDADETQALRSAVDRELDRLVRYGPLRIVEVVHPDDDAEKTQYKLQLSSDATSIKVDVSSIETFKKTGNVKIARGDVARAISHAIKADENETDFTNLVVSAGFQVVKGDKFKLQFTNKNRVKLAVLLPLDDFTGAAECFADIGFVYF